MTARNDLERRLADFYESEAPPRAPEWVLGTVLETIDTTRQRHALVRVPWRLPRMNSYAKWAIATVVVLAVGALGFAFLRPGPAPGVGGPSVSSPSPAPTVSPDPSAPPPLAESFTSTQHGITMSYPAGWTVRRATEPWTPTSERGFQAPALDNIYDPVLNDHLFFGIASQPLAGVTPDEWVTDFLADPDTGCRSGPTEPITIDGANGRMCEGLAAVSAGGRGYFVRLYTSGDEPWLSTYYDQAWFRGVLDTVRLDPAAAVDASPSPSSS